MVKKKNELSIIIMIFSMTLIAVTVVFAEEQCLKNAWEAFNMKDYEKAIIFADECIDNFGRAASRVQMELERSKVPPPPTGSVSAPERDKIFKRGLLNDVATSCWIKGRSAEYLYRNGGPKKEEYKRMAEEAYRKACEYKYGRTWDPKGWFWSPCEAANDRLPLD